MITVTAKENSSILVTDELLADLHEIGMVHFPNIVLQENKIILPKYTVGEMRLAHHTIHIEPLNPAMALENIFEMFAYTENIDNTHMLNVSHSYQSSASGFGNFIGEFLLAIEKLITFGVTSTYDQQKSWVQKGIGSIDASKFNKQLLMVNGIYAKKNYHTKDSTTNRILLKALRLVKELHGSTFNDRLMEPFFGVQPYQGNLTAKDENKALKEYSPNPYNSIALAYALMIIKDLNIGYSKEGAVRWHSFLVNSNQIYEKYLRSLLDRNLVQPVQKLSKPLPFATNSAAPHDVKFVEPDILINFNKNTHTAQMVLDAKNKKIHTKKPLGSISTGDVYQITYYASIFKAKSGALVYPVTKDMHPVRIHIKTDSHAKFYLIGINMSKTIEERHSDFITAVSDILRNSG